MTFSTGKIINDLIKSNPDKYKKFYKKMTFEEIAIINKKLVDTLKVFDEICRSNNLTYMLVAGGLIGAIRDGKCIPWDDDIDLVMPRDDYNEFGKILKNSKDKYPNYEMKYPENNDVITMGAHFYDKNVKLTNLISGDIGESNIYEAFVNLDILPIDFCPENRIKNKIIGLLSDAIQMGYISRRCFKKVDPFVNFLAKDSLELKINLIIRSLFAVPFLVFSKKILFSFLNKLYKNQKGSDYMTIPYGALRYFGEETPADFWYPVKDIDFCGLKVMAPNKPEEYLRHRYGDFEKIPPIEDQEERMIRLRHDWENFI